MPLKENEATVIDAIDHDEMIDFLRELISAPSFEGKETQAQMKVSKKMKEIGLETSTWKIDFEGLRSHPSFSMSIERNDGLGVIGTYGGGRGKSLLLNGHIDVVAPGDESKWIHPPWGGVVEKGRIYGRGAADMKGGIACLLYAVKALIDSGVNLKGKVITQSVIGEEDGGVGALDATLRGYKADAAIITEPSDLNVVPAHAGVMAFKVTIVGKSAHASIRDEGVSAIDKFLPLYDALKKLEVDRNKRIHDPLYSNYKIPSPLSIGKIVGGEWPGTVPESLYFEGRVGVHTDETCEAVRRQVEEAIMLASNKDPWLQGNKPKVEWRGYHFDPAKIPSDHSIIRTVSACFKDVMGSPPMIEGKTYSSDMRLLVNVGKTPTMIFGPGEIREAHAANESVSIENLEKAAQIIALSILRWCSQ